MIAALPSLLHPLSTGSAALLLIAGGLLLLLAEGLRPGSVIPGAAGLLLLLLGLHRLVHLPLRGWGVALLALGCGLLSASLVSPLRWIAGPCAAFAFAFGFPRLTLSGATPVDLVLGPILGFSVGTVAFLLLQIAGRARANKRRATDARSAVQEWQSRGSE